ncbi:MAG TPA: TadE family type IV pilus minor pilin [Pseudonocardiaceae bacterium]|jgi:hypothetical protein
MPGAVGPRGTVRPGDAVRPPGVVRPCDAVRQSGARQRRDGERGSTTVEAALAVCAVIVVLAMALAGSAAVLAQLRCTDAAREAARLVARGEPDRAEEAARRIAPVGARIEVSVHGDEVTVDVGAEPGGGILPGLSVRAQAMAVLEPGVAGVG